MIQLKFIMMKPADKAYDIGYKKPRMSFENAATQETK
jgi:hypothetical protein